MLLPRHRTFFNTTGPSTMLLLPELPFPDSCLFQDSGQAPWGSLPLLSLLHSCSLPEGFTCLCLQLLALFSAPAIPGSSFFAPVCTPYGLWASQSWQLSLTRLHNHTHTQSLPNVCWIWATFRKQKGTNIFGDIY